MTDLKLDDYIAIATHDVSDENDFRVWCDCGNELHYYDDDTLSRCDSCDPDRETKQASCAR